MGRFPPRQLRGGRTITVLLRRDSCSRSRSRVIELPSQLSKLGLPHAILRLAELIQEFVPADTRRVAVFARRGRVAQAVLALESAHAARGGGGTAGGDVEVPDRADAVETVLQRGEGRALREQHEEAVEAFVEVGEALGLEELHAEVGEDGGFEELDQLVDLD